MPFATEREAKQFLSDKIYQESQFQGSPITDVDRRLLIFSEQDPGSEEGIPEDVLSADPDPDWERRMTELLRQAWHRDKTDPAERQIYLDAMDRLKAGDHYIQIIAGPVLPTVSSRNIALYVVAGIVVLLAIAAVWFWKSGG